jgi:hypothetical protein
MPSKVRWRPTEPARDLLYRMLSNTIMGREPRMFG